MWQSKQYAVKNKQAAPKYHVTKKTKNLYFFIAIKTSVLYWRYSVILTSSSVRSVIWVFVTAGFRTCFFICSFFQFSEISLKFFLLKKQLNIWKYSHKYMKYSIVERVSRYANNNDQWIANTSWRVNTFAIISYVVCMNIHTYTFGFLWRWWWRQICSHKERRRV